MDRTAAAFRCSIAGEGGVADIQDGFFFHQDGTAVVIGSVVIKFRAGNGQRGAFAVQINSTGMTAVGVACHADRLVAGEFTAVDRDH